MSYSSRPIPESTLHYFMKYIRLPFFLISLSMLTVACQKDEVNVPEEYVNESFYIRNNKADLYTTARGNQLTNSIIINIHGGPAQGAQLIALTRPVVYEELEKLGIVIYYDQRGIGLSTGNFSENTITLSQFKDDLNSVIEICKFKYGSNKSIFLLSRSWGGLLAAEYLVDLDLQSKIAGWINVAGAYDLPKMISYGKSKLMDIANEQIDRNHSVQKWLELKEYASTFDTTNFSWDNISRLWTKGVEGMQILENDGEIVENRTISGLSMEEAHAHPSYSSFEVTQNDGQNIADIILEPLTSYSPALEKIQLPTSFIYGKYDLLVPSDLAEDGFNTISTPASDKYLHIYPAQAHFPMGNFEQFTSQAKTFIESYE